MDKTTWICKHFDELSTRELYDMMVLRQEVFVVEQDCPYLDADGKDLVSHHLMGYQGTQLVAYTRLIDKGVSYDNYVSIGRVITSLQMRNTGIGKELMQQSIDAIYKKYGNLSIKISAQSYLLRFYQSFGFEAIGEEYLEDGIPHTAMLKGLIKD